MCVCGVVFPDLGARLSEFLMPYDRMRDSAGAQDRGVYIQPLKRVHSCKHSSLRSNVHKWRDFFKLLNYIFKTLFEKLFKMTHDWIKIL